MAYRVLMEESWDDSPPLMSYGKLAFSYGKAARPDWKGSRRVVRFVNSRRGTLSIGKGFDDDNTFLDTETRDKQIYQILALTQKKTLFGIELTCL